MRDVLGEYQPVFEAEDSKHAEVDEEENDSEVDESVVESDEAVALQNEDDRHEQTALRHTEMHIQYNTLSAFVV